MLTLAVGLSESNGWIGSGRFCLMDVSTGLVRGGSGGKTMVAAVGMENARTLGLFLGIGGGTSGESALALTAAPGNKASAPCVSSLVACLSEED